MRRLKLPRVQSKRYVPALSENAISDNKANTLPVFSARFKLKYSPNLTAYPNTTEYAFQSEGYWVLQSRVLLPFCRFAPRFAEDVAFEMNTIKATSSRFTITSGPHSIVLGARNTGKSVTIDLNVHMRQVEIDEANSMVHVQPVAKWGDVYQSLESRRWIVAGGRLSDVGVGGFLLGGGISYHGPRKGWASDSVLALAVVLASCEIVRASPTSHPDLYWALRGWWKPIWHSSRVRTSHLQPREPAFRRRDNARLG